MIPVSDSGVTSPSADFWEKWKQAENVYGHTSKAGDTVLFGVCSTAGAAPRLKLTNNDMNNVSGRNKGGQ